MHDHIFITGFMGSGKSTIGRKLAGYLKLPFIDTDNEIERACGVEIKDIFRNKGESYFRRLEEQEVFRQCHKKERAVISLGGGALISEKSLADVLKSGILIYIESSPEGIWQRTHHSTRRPLMPRSTGPEEHKHRVDSLLQERAKGYRAAHIKINRDGMEAEAVVKKLMEKIKEYR
jgi:shikimate kinase